MADKDRIIDVTIRTTFDKAGSEQAKKEIAKIAVTPAAAPTMSTPANIPSDASEKLAQLQKRLSIIADDASPRATIKLAKLSNELKELRKSTDLTADELARLAKIEGQIGGAANRIASTKAEMVRLDEGIRGQVKSQTVMNELLDEGRGRFGSIASAAGMFTGAFAGGIAIGTKILEKAGVSTEEWKAALDSVVTTLAKVTNAIIGTPFKWLGTAIASVGDKAAGLQNASNLLSAEFQRNAAATISMAQAARELGVHLKGNETIVAAYANKIQQLRNRQEDAAQGAAKLAEQTGVQIKFFADNEQAASLLEKQMGLLLTAGRKLSDETIIGLRGAFTKLLAAGVPIPPALQEMANKLRIFEQTAAEAAQSGVRFAEMQIRLHGATSASLAALTSAKIAEARITGKTEQDIQSIRDEAAVRNRERSNEAFSLFARNQVLIKGETMETLRLIEQARIREVSLEQNAALKIRAIRLDTAKQIGMGYNKNADEMKALFLESQNKMNEETALFAQTMEVRRNIRNEAANAESRHIDARITHEQAAGTLSLDSYRKMRMRQIELTRLAASDGIAAAREAADAEIALNDEIAAIRESSERQKATQAIGAVNAALGAAAEAFPEIKEIAIAQTLINTYQGAMAAWASLSATGPYGYVLGAAAAAVIVAAGIKNVANIMDQRGPSKTQVSTTPSFDDPINDAAARFAGQKSAKDFITQTRIGFDDAFRSGAAFAGARTPNTDTAPGTRNTAIDSAPRTMELHLHGHSSTPPKEYVRAFTRAQRLYLKGTETRVVGSSGKGLV